MFIASVQIILTVLFFGALGGLAQSIRSNFSYRMVLPRMLRLKHDDFPADENDDRSDIDGRAWNAGVLGHIFVGILAAFVVVGILAWTDNLDIEGFYGSTDGDGRDAWPLAFLKLVAISISSGFAGLALLNRAGAEIESRLNQELSRERQERILADEREKKERSREDRIGRGIDAMPGPPGKSWSDAIRHFQAVLDDPDTTEDDRCRALGLISWAEKRGGRVKDALAHIDELIRLRPNDDNAAIFANRACYRWLVCGEEAIDDVLADLGRAVELEPRFILDRIDNDPDLTTLRERPAFHQWRREQQSDTPRGG